MAKVLLIGFAHSRNTAHFMEMNYDNPTDGWEICYDIIECLKRYPKLGTVEEAIVKLRNENMYTAGIQIYQNGIRKYVGTLVVSDTVNINACRVGIYLVDETIPHELKDEIYDTVKSFLDTLGYVDIEFC